jgi:hypothetical protein
LSLIFPITYKLKNHVIGLVCDFFSLDILNLIGKLLILRLNVCRKRVVVRLIITSFPYLAVTPLYLIIISVVLEKQISYILIMIEITNECSVTD